MNNIVFHWENEVAINAVFTHQILLILNVFVIHIALRIQLHVPIADKVA